MTDALSELFHRACQRLQLEPNIAARAIKMANEMHETAQPVYAAQEQLRDRAWLATAVFAAQHTDDASRAPELRRLLGVFQVRVKDFCLHLRLLHAHFQHEFPDSFTARIRTIQALLLQRFAIYRKYEKLHRLLNPPSFVLGGDHDRQLACGWMLFLVIKAEGSFPEEFHTMYVLLLAVLHLVLLSAPQGLKGDILGKLCTVHTKPDQALQSRVTEEQADFLPLLHRLVDDGTILCPPVASPPPLPTPTSLPLAVSSSSSQSPSSSCSSSTSVSVSSIDGSSSTMVPCSPPPSNAALEETCSTTSPPSAASLRRFSRIFATENLGHNLNGLETKYTALLGDDDDVRLNSPMFRLNERVFLDERERHPPLPPSPASRKRRNEGDHRPSTSTPAPTQKRARIPATPVSRMMEAVSWLNNSCRKTTSTPGPTLARCLASKTAVSQGADKAKLHAQAVAQVEDNARLLAQTITFPGSTRGRRTFDTQDSSRGERTTCLRRELALKLYYRVLEGMLLAEETRLGPGAQAAFVWSRSFHRSLFACCFQIVIFAYKVQALAFPHVLEAFKLTSWEFLKVIESVIRHGGDFLPIKTHLMGIEAGILEHRAWSKGEALPKLLRSACNRDYVAWLLRPLMEDAAPGLDASGEGANADSESTNVSSAMRVAHTSSVSTVVAAACVSDAKEETGEHGTGSDDTADVSSVLLPNPTAFSATPSHVSSLLPSPSKAARPPASCSPSSRPDGFALNLFFRKLLQQARERLEWMCLESTPVVPQQFVDLVWVLVLHVLTVKIDLVIGRHIDTIILCSIYAVCNKVGKLDVKFRQIVSVYLSRWGEKSLEAVHSVGESGQNIIVFYNDDFIHEIKVYLISTIKPLARQRSVEGFRTPPKQARSRYSSPRHTAMRSPGFGSPRGNFYMSPLRQTRRLFDSHLKPAAHLTPRSKWLFALGDSPQKIAFAGGSPRKKLSECNAVINRGPRKLSYDLSLLATNPLPAPDHRYALPTKPSSHASVTCRPTDTPTSSPTPPISPSPSATSPEEGT